ncbi:uncharacterized protein LOC106674438 [Cimex lectularius]|uniref:ZBR-type domain-containing protein n=1 Tax=Cimex lectularius TaxID=79782 RepID=A0A8I6SDT8_CIMLE|nr:uncharacterized protein LOC106674438 [Cimex lectularius]
MSEARSSPYQSPIEDVFSWAIPNEQTRKDKFTKRKCEDDSGYTSPLSSLRSNMTHTPFRPSGTMYNTSSGEMSTSFLSFNLKKRMMGDRFESQDDILTDNSSLPGVSTYSEFLMDASLYMEPMETNTDSICSPTDQKDQDSLLLMEVCKDIDVDLTIESGRYATPTSSFQISLTPTKLSRKTSPRKRSPKKNLLKSFSRSRSLYGFERVDLFFQLGGRANHSLVISKILDYLSDADISSMTMVSKTWKNICLSDPKAKSRWLKYISHRRSIKENLGKVKYKEKRNLAPLVPRNHSTPLQTRQSTSPPISPSKRRFHLFQKEAKTLKENEILMQCPRCRHPASCSSLLKVGECRSELCKQRFCSMCKGAEHNGRMCLSITPTTPTKRTCSVSSKQSKRYLRRL